MKITWREQPDGSWEASHYPRADSEWLTPYKLHVWQDESTFPWQWEVKRHDEVLGSGAATEDEGARFSATGQLVRQLFPS